MKRPCSHRGPLTIQATDPEIALRVSDPDALVRVQNRLLVAVQWCAQCGAIGFDGAWIPALERVEAAR
jgi:hypothetical protein